MHAEGNAGADREKEDGVKQSHNHEPQPMSLSASRSEVLSFLGTQSMSRKAWPFVSIF
jgi:hypothetical protein